MDPLKMYLLLKMVVFHGYVSLPESIAQLLWSTMLTGLGVKVVYNIQYTPICFKYGIFNYMYSLDLWYM